MHSDMDLATPPTRNLLATVNPGQRAATTLSHNAPVNIDDLLYDT